MPETGVDEAYPDAKPVSLTLPFASTSARIARTRMNTWMTEKNLPMELVEDGRLVVSELVANAVLHARPLEDGTMLVEWSHDPRGVEISVTDGGASTVPEVRDADPLDIDGRGMSIVEVLSKRWWLETTRTRSTVHAVLGPAQT